MKGYFYSPHHEIGLMNNIYHAIKTENKISSNSKLPEQKKIKCKK